LGKLLHLTGAEAWAFSVLLVGLTGLNACVIEDLPAPHLRASTDDEPGIALVDVRKPRRGSRAAMTVPLTALRTELQAPTRDTRPQRVLNTSLTTAFGVFMLLLELTEPARRQIGSDRAFVFYSGSRGMAGHPIGEGLPHATGDQRESWVRPWWTGDPQHDAGLAGVSWDRLRKTHLHATVVRSRTPRRPWPVTYVGCVPSPRRASRLSARPWRNRLSRPCPVAP